MRMASRVPATSCSCSDPCLVFRNSVSRDPLAVGLHLHPAAVPAWRAPLDLALLIVGPERGLAVLLAALVPCVYFDAVATGWPYGGHLRHEPRQVARIRDRGVDRVRRSSDVLSVLVLHINSSRLATVESRLPPCGDPDV